MSRRKHYDFTTDHSKGVKSGAVTLIKQQPRIVVEGPSEDFPEGDYCHLERSDSGVSDVTMTVRSLMPTETGTPSGGAHSNQQDQRESGIFEVDGDIARSDTDCNRLSTFSTDSGRPSSMEGILDDSLPLHEGANKTTEWEGKAGHANTFEELRDAANNTVPPVSNKEEAELVKKPWRLSKLEHSRPRRYSGSPNTRLPPFGNELRDEMSTRIGSEGPGCLKIPIGDSSSDSQAGLQLGTSLPCDDLMTDGSSPGFDMDDPIVEESENINDSQETTTGETKGEPESTSGGPDADQNGPDAEDMIYGRVSKTWEHEDSCAVMPVYDARGKFSHTGGRLELRYRGTTVRLDVPAGAVPEGETREIFIRALPSRGIEPTAVFCGPHGTVFKNPVTLSYSTDGEGDKAAVQGFLTPTDFGDPTSWHDISDDPDTSFKSEDCMHHFTLKHFTGFTSDDNGASQRTGHEQQRHIVKTFHLYYDYQVFELNGKMMTVLVLRLYIADEDQTENIEARERQLEGRPCDAPRCLTFTADNDNPLQIRLNQPLEHAWNFMGLHVQTIDIRTIRGARLTSCLLRLSSAHNAAMPVHCNVELSQEGNTSSVTLGVDIVPPQCCCRGRPNSQLMYERHCHNNPGYDHSDAEEHLQGAVGGHLTMSHLPVSQCAEETGSQERKVKHPVEDACHCEKCQDSKEGQSCHTEDTCTGCHLCTEESSSQTSMPTHPGTDPHPQLSHPLQETSHQTSLSTEVPDTHLSTQTESTNQPVQESSQESNPPAAAASHHHSEHLAGSQQNSRDQGAAANSPEPPPPQPTSKLHKLLKKLNVKPKFAQKLSDTIRKQKTKSKPPKEQASADMSKDQAEKEVTKGENSRDPNLPTQEASQATQSSKKDSAYISGVPEGEEEVESPDDNHHLTATHRGLQRDSGVHDGEGSCPQLASSGPEKIPQEEGNPGEETSEDGNKVDQETSSEVSPGEQQAVVLRKDADPEKTRESGYTSGVPSMCGDPDVS